MPNELTTKPDLSESIERALIHGDLKDLDTQGRIQFYNQVCASLGLNPLTKPFSYIVLNGKLTLYALRDCTEQLRKIHGVSITKVTPQQIGDLLVCVAEARDRTGRCDSSTGAVSILEPEKLKDRQGNYYNNPKAGKQIVGEDLANAMMKCETKSKRRVTLSLCGLGLLDESEVDTLREQGVAKPEQVAAEAKWAALDPEGFKAPQPGDKLKADLEASIAHETAKASPIPQKPQEQAPERQEYPFSYQNGILNARIVGIIEKQTKPGKGGKTRPFLNVTFNGRAEGFNFFTVFDTKLFDVIQDCLDHQCEIALTFDGKFLGIKDVLTIDGVNLAKEDKP